MLRKTVLGLTLAALVAGIAVVGMRSSPDCMDETTVVGGHTYQVSTCR